MERNYTSREGTSKADRTSSRGKDVCSVPQEKYEQTWQDVNNKNMTLDEWIKREKQKTHKAANFAKGLLSVEDTRDYIKSDLHKKLSQEKGNWQYCTDPSKESQARTQEIDYLCKMTKKDRRDPSIDKMVRASIEIRSYTGYIYGAGNIGTHIATYKNARSKFIKEHREKLGLAHSIHASSDEFNKRYKQIDDLCDRSGEKRSNLLIQAMTKASNAIHAYREHPYAEEAIKAHVEEYNQAKKQFLETYEEQLHLESEEGSDNEYDVDAWQEQLDSMKKWT